MFARTRVAAVRQVARVQEGEIHKHLDRSYHFSFPEYAIRSPDGESAGTQNRGFGSLQVPSGVWRVLKTLRMASHRQILDFFRSVDGYEVDWRFLCLVKRGC